MEDVISLSSDSDQDDSDVEIVGCYTDILARADPLPLTAVRIDVDAVNVNVPMPYIDLKNPKWILPELKMRKRQNSTSVAVIDLTESNTANGTEQETENLPPEDGHIKKEIKSKNSTFSKQDFNLQKSSSKESTVFALQQDCGKPKPKQRCLDHQMQTDKAHNCTPTVTLRRLSFLETYVTEMKASKSCVHLAKDCTPSPLHVRQLDGNGEVPESISNLSTASNSPHVEPSLDEALPKMVGSLVRHKKQSNSDEFTNTQLNAKVSPHVETPAESPHEDNRSSAVALKGHDARDNRGDDFCSSVLISSPTSPSSSQGDARSKVVCNSLDQMESGKADSRQSCPSRQSPRRSPTIGPKPFDYYSLSHTSAICHKPLSQVNPTPTCERTTPENVSEWKSEKVKADECSSISSGPFLSACKAENTDDGSGTGTCRGDLGIDSPVSYIWQDGSDGEQVNDESRFDLDFRQASSEDRDFVCPDTFRKIMSGPAQALIDVEDEDFKTPEQLCRQSLSLVYSTIEENYPEGTVQLLSDLLQPGYYPPRDITFHLLHGILLDPQCPYHLCTQAFNLLMRTQRHHMADKTTVPWDWESLTSVVANQDHKGRHRCEIMRMLLEYVVQTLEDDFQAKRSDSALHLSIAKATLSCDQQFPHVRDVIKWLFTAIIKSTEQGEGREAAKERAEQIRMVTIFQRMLSLALEVDRFPALNSDKLSQELFHMLIGNITLRAHRMLLLESLQSKLLRCKLLEHLLDYACPLKISLPMSLSLLLHFLKNCTLAPDPTDGAERWQRWEELIHLLWMLLLSYKKAMKDYLCSSVTDQSGRVGTLVYKQDDMVSKSAVREAVEAFLSRSQADLGQALPLHVEESLTYLQDQLLDVC